MSPKIKLTPDDLECSEGGIHDFPVQCTRGDYFKMVFCCPCVLVYELCCDCSMCGARDPERDGFGCCGRATGKKACVKCNMTYEAARSQLSNMTEEDKQRVWNATYGDQNVYMTRAQERELQHIEVVASHHHDAELNGAYAELHDGHQRQVPPYPRTQIESGQSHLPPPYKS